MKQLSFISFLLASLVLGYLFVNGRSQSSPQTSLPFTVPQGWPEPVYDFRKNPLTREGFELGRKLFYDGRLSKDGNFPCASCHQQFAAFATYEHNVSHGFNNSFTTRNAPGLFNLAWQKEFMLDGGINHLDAQPLAPLTAHNEMAASLDTIVMNLRNDKQYRNMFRAAFGNDTINTQRMTKALSQFLLMIVSSNSKYDKVLRGEASFTLSQQLGYNIFKQKCEACHKEPLFTDFSYRNIGLPLDTAVNDYGRMNITGNPQDSLKFRVPSLRNVMLTFPYMHDGRFYSVLEVFNHYRNGVVKEMQTDSLVRNRVPLSNFEIGQLTSFLYTLTDSSLLSDQRFGPPGINRTLQPPAEHIHPN